MQKLDYIIKISDLPIAEKPRERLKQKGVKSLSNWELISILIGSGTTNNDVITIAHQIIAQYKDVSELAKANYHDLLIYKGLGSAKISILLAAIELAKRINKNTMQEFPFMKAPEDYYRFIKDEICYEDKERLIVFCLNTRCKIIHHETITIGTVNQALIHPREVFKPAFAKSATYIALAHNHPSGDVNPSEDDITITRRLVSVSRYVGIPLIDHIIVSCNGYFSMKSSGLLNESRTDF